MNITFRQLQVFEVVARHLNYTRASEELHLTQPAVSMQIKQLEAAVGLPLFEIMGKRVFLTEAGRELYHYSRQITQLLHESEHVLTELKGLQRGHLDIAVVTTANSFSSHLLASFCKQHSDISLSLNVCNREKVLDLLMKNEVDIAIMDRPAQELDLSYRAFMENPLVAVASPRHRLSQAKHIPLHKLRDETFLVREDGSGTRISIEQFFQQKGIRLKSRVEMSSNEAIKEAIQAGLGLGIVSLHTISLELETGRLVVLDVDEFPIYREWYVVHRQEKRLTAVVQAFKQFVIDHAQEFNEARRLVQRFGIRLPLPAGIEIRGQLSVPPQG